MQVLSTKLFTPTPRFDAVARPRLLAQLQAGLERRLTLISAPAGFGKTTLLAQWLTALQDQPLPIRSAWLALDEGERNPERFVAYLGAALHAAAPTIGVSTATAPGVPPPPIETLLTRMLNQLAALNERIVLVLDDYHLIGSAPIDQVLAFVIAHLPTQIHLVIATREDPHLPLARYRARGHLAELRAADLRFISAEAENLLNAAMNLALPSTDLVALETRTEGWVTGLQLAALSLRGRPDPSAFIRSFAGNNRFVTDYLVAEVLRQQPPEREAFLLTTAILGRLCGPLCDAILAAPSGSSQALLEALEDENLFLFPLDHERRWYRYHQLFAEVLQQQSQRVAAKPPVATYHLRASQWFEEHGLVAEAVHHALAAADFARVAQIAERAWQAMDERFQLGAWLTWVRRLPESLLNTRPVLSVQYASALVNHGDLEASEHHLAQVERLLATHDGHAVSGDLVIFTQAQIATLVAQIAIIRAFAAQARGDSTATAAYARLALGHLPATEQYLRLQALVLLGFTHWANGDLAAAYQAMADWSEGMRQIGNISFVVASAIGLAEIRTAQGQLQAAIAIYEQALHLADQHDLAVQQAAANLSLELALLCHEIGRAEAVGPLLRTSYEMGEQTPMIDWRFRWYRAQAQLKADEGDFAAARALLDQAAQHYVRNPMPDLWPIAALKAELHLRQGQLAEAQAWARVAGVRPDDPPSYLREFEHLVLARLRIAEYQRTRNEPALRAVLGLLARLLAAAEAQGRTASCIAILVVQALAFAALSDETAACAALERALALAEPEGYHQLFVREGAPIARLLALVAHQRAPHRYAERLLAALGQPATNAPVATVEPLSQREREVLRLIAAGLSNQQIAERLHLAVSSVKGHNLRIFAKLQVQRRTEAIARAQELGLL